MAAMGKVAVRSVATFALIALASCSGKSGAATAAGGTAAFGGAESMAGGGGNSAAAGTASGGAAAGTSSGGSAAAGGGVAGAATTHHYGQVLVESLLPGVAENHGVLLDVSFTSGSTGMGPTCTTTTDGPCHVDVCDDASSTGAATHASAGTVTITSSDLMGSAVATADAAGNYTTSTFGFPSAFLGAEHLQVSASGGEVPAFQGDVDVPLVLLLTSPPYTKGQASVDVQRSSDLSLVWTRGVKDVVLWVQGYSVRADQEPGSAYLTCQFPSETGSGTIKSALLQQLGADGRLNLLTIDTKSVVAGDYSVTLAVAMPTANPDKALLPQLTLK